MKKTLKIFTIILMAMVVLATNASMAFGASALVDQIQPTLKDTTAAAPLTGIATKVVSLIQMASAVLAVILIAVFGFKFILGSANEKADYQKSFIPLIVGIVVVFAATSIAKLLFGIMG